MSQPEATMFPVLNTAKTKRQAETERRLPTWIAQPTQFAAVNLLEYGQDIDELAEYIDDDIRRHLKKVMLIERAFPVQKCLIPDLSRLFKSRSFMRPNDVCVSSPTGSGKTLAFAIPIVNYLKKSLARSFRALVVLPSRDLAFQVHKTFQQICTPTHLRCVIAVAESPEVSKSHIKRFQKNVKEQPNINKANNDNNNNTKRKEEIEESIASKFDILISTPGTLTDLIHNGTSGFCLKDLEILVIDEADRLMTSHRHDWLNAIERSIFSSFPNCPCDEELKSRGVKRRKCYSSVTACSLQNVNQTRPLQKLLFSATLSSDPQLLMHMNLFQPRLYIATKPSITSLKIRNSSVNSTPIGSPGPKPLVPDKVNIRNELLTSSAIPEQLEEKMFITEPKEKLFVLWYLFHELKYRKVICFTNQLPTSFRLCKFLNEVHEVRAVEFSSNMKPEARQKYLNEFTNGKIDVIVSTDLMARGMDVQGVDYVISYDMPASEIFYVHRVGRTARAGNKGTAITLVDTKQLVQFKKIVQLAHKMPNSMRLSDVVEEMKVPQTIKKSSEKYELYTKTLDEYEDKVNSISKKAKYSGRTK